ncbi:phytase [Marinobacter sp. JSM 1782161]|uniref:phytase n=1 Tax=Marinobacter sp. JSM 1782161 TaxID=2685906 RepID=UPI00140255F5|nr:phytase [Marinobacter sp. JSM 1782161]
MINNRKAQLAGLASSLLAVTLLAGCESQTRQDTSTRADTVENVAWQTRDLAGEWAYPLDSERWLSVGEASGIRLSDGADTLDHHPVAAEYLDQRGGLFVSFDSASGRLLFYRADDAALSFQPVTQPAPINDPVEGLCLYRDADQDLYLFVLSELHRADQYRVREDGPELALQPVRSLPIPPESAGCAVDDRSGRLYVAEAGVGVWGYDADPEAAIERTPVAMATPFGDLPGGPVALAAAPGRLLVLAGDRLQLRTGDTRDIALDGAEAPETLSVRWSHDRAQVAIFDDSTGFYRSAELAAPAPSAEPVERLPAVAPLVETAPVPNAGDAADDPAVWVNASDPGASRVLGTNKRQGLHVYDLNGRERQSLPVGRVNNVDVRYGVDYRGQVADVAVASNRTRNSLSLFAIERDSGTVVPVVELATDLPEIYGLCLYQPGPDRLYAFANDKSGRYVQYRLDLTEDHWGGEAVREFSLDSQPEGCVADDDRQRLFVGEEGYGIWVLDAEPDGDDRLTLVDAVGERLHDDVEGLSLYAGDYLVASSQGNNSYVVYDAKPPFAPVGGFRIGANHGAMIDGASETDGLTVVASDLGGPWSDGLLVVQDGRNVLPADTQNFKLVPWRAVRETLGLPAHDGPALSGQGD